MIVIDFLNLFKLMIFMLKKLTLQRKTQTSLPNIAQSEQIGVQQSLQ